MASIPLSEVAIKSVKSAVREILPSIPSAHLTEALAFAVGKNTHAALLEAIKTAGARPHFVLLNESRFGHRLKELGHTVPSKFSFEKLEAEHLVSTGKPAGKRSRRWQAWRNLMVAGVNAGLKAGHFSLTPYDNRWKNPSAAIHRGVIFDFRLETELPARCYVTDISGGELTVHVAANPTGDELYHYDSGFRAGDALATGWLERQDGAWLQDSGPMLTCRKWLIDQIADLEVQPLGFGDFGKFYR